jgi:hypothetical protein
MMRFIFYFVFFGLLFYIIWMYFPEAFQTLVSWAGKIYSFLFNLLSGVVERLNDWSGPHTPPAPAPTPAPLPADVPKAILHHLGL